jgi:hypothetical protein
VHSVNGAGRSLLGSSLKGSAPPGVPLGSWWATLLLFISSNVLLWAVTLGGPGRPSSPLCHMGLIALFMQLAEDLGLGLGKKPHQASGLSLTLLTEPRE